MWFVETPWPPILICGVVAVLLIAAWHAQGRGTYLLGVLGLALLSVGIYVVERLIVTERERVEAAVYELTTAFQQGETAQTLDLISPQSPELRQLVRGAMEMVDVEDDLRITDLRVEMRAEGSRAIAHFRANATIHVRTFGHSGRHPSRWELTWRREADEWKVLRAQRLHPLTGEELNFWAQVR